MGNREKQLDEKRDKKDRDRVSRETLGKFFYDLAKLAFAALVVGSITSIVMKDDNIESWIIIGIGSFVTCVFAYIGYKIIK